LQWPIVDEDVDGAARARREHSHVDIVRFVETLGLLKNEESEQAGMGSNMFARATNSYVRAARDGKNGKTEVSFNASVR
jgi:hypothetical protein